MAKYEHRKINNSDIEIKIGDTYLSNTGNYIIEVIKVISSKEIIITFNGKDFLSAHSGDVRSGKIKNPEHKGIHFIGYIGYGNCSKTNNKKSYSVWQAMIQRCYCPIFQSKNPTYFGCSVIEEWHNFQNFNLWFDKNYIEFFQLDKDLLFKNNKIYSDENCCFIPQQINTALITTQNMENKDIHVGVSKSGRKFRMQCRIEDNMKITKNFNDINEAISYYKIIKGNYIKRLAEKYKNKLEEKQYLALINWKV